MCQVVSQVFTDEFQGVGDLVINRSGNQVHFPGNFTTGFSLLSAFYKNGFLPGGSLSISRSTCSKIDW